MVTNSAIWSQAVCYRGEQRNAHLRCDRTKVRQQCRDTKAFDHHVSAGHQPNNGTSLRRSRAERQCGERHQNGQQPGVDCYEWCIVPVWGDWRWREAADDVAARAHALRRGFWKTSHPRLYVNLCSSTSRKGDLGKCGTMTWRPGPHDFICWSDDMAMRGCKGERWGRRWWKRCGEELRQS